MFLRYLYYNTTLCMTTCFDPQFAIIRQSNQLVYTIKPNQSLLYSVDVVYNSQRLKCRHYFAKGLRKRDGSSYTVSTSVTLHLR